MITKLSSRWYELGKALLDDEQQAYVDATQAEIVSLSEKCTKMFHCWINSSTNATWNNLLEAVKELGDNEMDFAANILKDIFVGWLHVTLMIMQYVILPLTKMIIIKLHFSEMMKLW